MTLYDRAADTAPSRRIVLSLGFIFFAALTIVIAASYHRLVEVDLDFLTLLATSLLIVTLSALIFTAERKLWFAPNVFMVVFSLFHFGVVFCQAFGFELSPGMQDYLREWWFTLNNRYAIVLVSLGTAAFAAGVFLVSAGTSNPASAEDDPELARLVAIAGFILLSGAIVSWFYKILAQGGLGILTTSYAAFRDATGEGVSVGYNYLFIGFGLVLTAVSPPSWLRRLGLALFALFAFAALSLGLRTHVLFPGCAALAAFGLKRPPFSMKKTIILGICLLSLISVVRQIRQEGLSGARLQEISWLPSDGLAEMGCSIRPVAEVVRWAGKGEEFMLGASYWAPFDRSLVYFIPEWPRPLAEEDERLLGEVIGRRVGSVGFSMVAEAYRNFGPAGVLGSMLLLGAILARLGLASPTITNQMRVGLVMMPLLMHVRNSFVSVPAIIAVGLAIVWLLPFFRSGRVRRRGLVKE